MKLAPGNITGNLIVSGSITAGSVGTGPGTTDLGQPSFQAHRGSAQSITTGVTTTLIFPTVDYDNYSGYNAGTGVYTIPAGCGGIWQFWLYVDWASNATGSRFGTIVLPGGNFTVGADAATDGFGRVSVPCGPVRMSAGDTISCTVFQNSGGTLGTATAPTPFFSGVRVGA